jgi:2-amino-4-hydroxy-6-hydroxymethyldihydropteridine diphosphokinase
MGQATIASVGLGANLGSPQATLGQALAALSALPRTTLVVVSPTYRSAPVGAAGPDFFNAVALLRTELDPMALLHELQRIEALHGRERPYRNAPRTLDLDLLLFGDACIDMPGLIVPHPRMHERAFVLRPLADVAPAAVIPGRGPVAECLNRVASQRLEKLRP